MKYIIKKCDMTNHCNNQLTLEYTEANSITDLYRFIIKYENRNGIVLYLDLSKYNYSFDKRFKEYIRDFMNTNASEILIHTELDVFLKTLSVDRMEQLFKYLYTPNYGYQCRLADPNEWLAISVEEWREPKFILYVDDKESKSTQPNFVDLTFDLKTPCYNLKTPGQRFTSGTNSANIVTRQLFTSVKKELTSRDYTDTQTPQEPMGQILSEMNQIVSPESSPIFTSKNTNNNFDSPLRENNQNYLPPSFIVKNFSILNSPN